MNDTIDYLLDNSSKKSKKVTVENNPIAKVVTKTPAKQTPTTMVVIRILHQTF